MLKRLAFVISMAAFVVAAACTESDLGITTSVRSQLAADDTVRAYQIEVGTMNRVVTLSGVVETRAAKEQALMIARQTEGVQDVVDHIAVVPEPAATTGDAAEDADGRSP